MEKLLLANMIRVCIDENSEERHLGRVYNPTIKEPIKFNDWGTMLVMVDKLFDRNGYPQAFQQKRSFKKEDTLNNYQYKPQCVMDLDEFYGYSGDIKTYNVIINSRQFSSWQGEVYDQDLNLIKKFNDAIDLLKIMID